MKALKRCTNPNCSGKKNYGEKDMYCSMCGKPLNYVCASCGKIMEDGSEKYCISCKIKREQKAENRKDKMKKIGVEAVAGLNIIAAVAGGAKHVLKEGVGIVKIIKK